MSCDQTIIELLSCYVDGEAIPQDAARAEAHLDTCSECREMVKEWRHGIEMLDWTYSRSLPENTAEIAFEPPAPKPEVQQERWSFRLPDVRILAAAAVMTFIALIGVTVYYRMTTIPMLGRNLTTVGKAQTVLVAKGIRLTIEPDTEITRLGEKSVSLVQGTIHAEVTNVRGFMVHTRKFEITDEGTKFEVHSDSKTDRVTVTDGRVTVSKGTDKYQVGVGETLTSTGDTPHGNIQLRQNRGAYMLSPGVSVVALAIIFPCLLYLVFWARMVIDVLSRQFKSGSERIAWILVILLWHGMGVVIYYYAVYRKDHPQKHLQFPLVGRRGDKRVVLSGNVTAILLAFLIPAAFIVRNTTGSWNLPIFLSAALVTWLVIAKSIQSSMKAPIEKVYDLDQPFNPGLHFWYLLVGRKGNKRVIQWWNVVGAWVLASMAFSYGIVLLSHEPSLVTLLMGAALGIMFVVACVVQILSYPLDVLTDFVTGERPNQEVRNRRYPLPGLVGRRNGGRVVMWANISMLSVAVTGFFSRVVLDHPGSVDLGRLLPIAICVFFGLVTLMVTYSLLVPLNKPSKLDDDDYNPNTPARITPLTLAARKNGKRVILWRNVPFMVLFWILVCALWFGMVAYIIYPNNEMTMHMWIALGIAGILGNTFRSLTTPLDKLPSLDDDDHTNE